MGAGVQANLQDMGTAFVKGVWNERIKGCVHEKNTVLAPAEGPGADRPCSYGFGGSVDDLGICQYLDCEQTGGAWIIERIR